MSRQNNQPRSERKTEGQRKEHSQDAVRSYSVNNRPPHHERNKADNTRVVGLDKQRLNDLYERSSI